MLVKLVRLVVNVISILVVVVVGSYNNFMSDVLGPPDFTGLRCEQGKFILVG